MMTNNIEIKCQETSWQKMNKSNIVKLGFWTAMWLLTMVLIKFGPSLMWDFNSTFSALAVILNLTLGVKMVLANIIHLKGLDEMQQRIQLNAMGITLGLSLVVGLSYSHLDGLNLINYHAEISHLVIFIALTYLLATYIGQSKYR